MIKIKWKVIYQQSQKLKESRTIKGFPPVCRHEFFLFSHMRTNAPCTAAYIIGVHGTGQVMKTMASKGRKMICGEAGAKLMEELIPTSGRGSIGG